MGTRLRNAYCESSKGLVRSIFFGFSRLANRTMGSQPSFALTRPRCWSMPNVGRATFAQIPVSRVGMLGRDRHIRVFKKRFRRDAANSVRGLHQVVAWAANVFVAEGIGKRDWLGQLPGTHQEARAVHIPTALTDHGSLACDLRLRFLRRIPRPD